MLNLFNSFFLLLFLGSLFSLSACKPNLLPMSSVSNTAENRAVMQFMDKYKNAIEQHSVAEVMALVAPDFYESSGTDNAEDDYGYSQLQQKLEKAFARVKNLTLRYHVQQIARKDDQLFVYYYFNEHILADFPVGEEWMAGNDVNRLVLRVRSKAQGGGYEILSGL
jgi:hypothetical protein